MAFPNYLVVDDFNRADEAPLTGSGRWHQLAGENGSYNLASNAIVNQFTSSTSGGSTFTAATYGGDVEVAIKVTLSSNSSNHEEVILNAKCSIDGWQNGAAVTGTGYRAKMLQTSANTVSLTIEKFLAGWLSSGGNLVQVATVGSISWSAGDELCFSLANDANGTLTIYQNGVSKVSGTDATYKAQQGWIWLHSVGAATNTILDDFKVGATITEITFRAITDDATVGTISWTNPGNAPDSDNVYATASMAAGTQSTHFLKCVNHLAANYPTGTTLVGITAKIECHADQTGQDSINNCKVIVGGTVSGTNHNSGGSTAPLNTDGVLSIGNDTDLWGVTPTVSQLNANDFGIAVGFQGLDTANTLSVDQIIQRLVTALPSAGGPILRDLSHHPQTISVMAQ